eukprot:9708091-Alexandrium_andersonii.AAC.1
MLVEVGLEEVTGEAPVGGLERRSARVRVQTVSGGAHVVLMLAGVTRQASCDVPLGDQVEEVARGHMGRSFTKA